MSVDARRLEAYYSESVPPSLLPFARGATAGIPGTWTPAGSIIPTDPVHLAQGSPVTVVASPATAWTTGQYVQTGVAGAAGRAAWTGTSWVSGAAPLSEEPVPTSANTKAEIVAWLKGNGVDLDDDALSHLTKAELLEEVADLTNEDEPEA